MPAENALRPFEGRPVIGAKIAVTNAGDGLSESLNVDPEELPLGTTIYVVLKTEVTQVRYLEVKDTDALVRHHTLRAGEGTIVDAGLVKDVLEDQAKRNRQARDEREGVQHLPLEDDQDEPVVESGPCDRCGKDRELTAWDDRQLCQDCITDTSTPSAAATAESVVRDIASKARTRKAKA